MNTIRSTWYGWATLCVAGGGAYYFAKRQINEDRATRYNKERAKQERLQRLEYSSTTFNDEVNSGLKKNTSSPGQPTSRDTTTSDGSSSTKDEPIPKAQTKSKYEGEPYRSKKGDRFS